MKNLITDVKFLLSQSKNRTYRQRTIDVSQTFINFLQNNGLTLRVILADGEIPGDTTEVYDEDLTDEGNAVVDLAYNKWLRGHDRGKAISDISILEKALKTVRDEVPEPRSSKVRKDKTSQDS